MQDPQDPLKGYSKDWRKPKADPLKDYSKDWRQVMEGHTKRANFDTLARDLTMSQDVARIPTSDIPVESSMKASAIVVDDSKLGEGGPIYMKHGHKVIDSTNKDPTGTVPTHRISSVRNLLMPGETVEALERRVLEFELPKSVETRVTNLDTLEPSALKLIKKLIETAEKDGVKLTVAETRRSQERQVWLFQKGRVNDEPIVTWTLTSNHKDGRAVDFISDKKGYKWLQENAPKHGLGVLGSMDPGHVEFTMDAEAEMENTKQANIKAMDERIKIIQDSLLSKSGITKRIATKTLRDLQEKRSLLEND